MPKYPWRIMPNLFAFHCTTTLIIGLIRVILRVAISMGICYSEFSTCLFYCIQHTIYNTFTYCIINTYIIRTAHNKIRQGRK